MNYPDCEIIECEQRSDEWFEARRGLLTASEMGAWLLDQKTKRGRDARERMICKLVARTAGAFEAPFFESEAMRRGTELEPEAVASFEEATGKKIREVGFCRSKLGLFGCSPDGLIVGESAGFEGKIPEGATHIRYRRAGELPDAYRWQVLGCMAVTGATSWHFQSYNPGLAPLRVRVERSDLTEELKAALIEFSRQAEVALAEEKKAWDEAFGSD